MDDARDFGEALGRLPTLDLERLARDFEFHRGREEARYEGLQHRLTAIETDMNNISKFTRAATRNNYLRMTVFGAGGAGLVQVVQLIIELVRGLH